MFLNLNNTLDLSFKIYYFSGGVKTKVEAKRSYSNYILPYKSVNTSKKKVKIIVLF